MVAMEEDMVEDMETITVEVQVMAEGMEPFQWILFRF